MDGRRGLAHVSAKRRVPHHAVPVVESAQHARIEHGPVLQHGVTDIVGRRHGTGHRLLDVQHGHAHFRQRDGQLGVGISTERSVGRLPGRFLQARCGGTYGDDVRAFRPDHLPEILVKRMDAPAPGKVFPALRPQVAARGDLQPFTRPAGRGDGIRKRRVPLVVDRTAHATQPDDSHAIGFHDVLRIREICTRKICTKDLPGEPSRMISVEDRTGPAAGQTFSSLPAPLMRGRGSSRRGRGSFRRQRGPSSPRRETIEPPARDHRDAGGGPSRRRRETSETPERRHRDAGEAPAQRRRIVLTRPARWFSMP